MKTCTVVKCMESSNRFNMHIAIFMSVCYWLFSPLSGKSHDFFAECKFGVMSILNFLRL